MGRISRDGNTHTEHLAFLVALFQQPVYSSTENGSVPPSSVSGTKS